MNSKGFTLVELLGVVVIFTVLVLIITVAADATLKKAKTKLSNLQIEYIEESAQAYYLKEGINNSSNDSFKMCVNVDYLIENDYIENEEVLDPKDYKELDGSVEITYKSEQFTYKYKETSCSYTYQSLDKICKRTNKGSVTTGSVPTGDFLLGDEYICEVKPGTEYHFFVIGVEGDKVNLILDRNINNDGTLATVTTSKSASINGIYSATPWISKEDYIIANTDNTSCEFNACNDEGPITAIKYIGQATESWINIPNLSETHEDSVYGSIYLKEKARLPKETEIVKTGCSRSHEVGSCPLWMVNYLYDNTYNGEYREPLSSMYGYWIFLAYAPDRKLGFYVWFEGFVNASSVDHEYYIGVRPVISIPKNNIY